MGDGASKDMQYIYQLEAEVKKLKKEIKGIEKRHEKVKRRMYDDFKADQKKNQKKFQRLKSLAENELNLKDNIIRINEQNHKKML